MAKRKLKTYKVSRTTTKHIIVDAWDEDMAIGLAIAIDEDEWTDEGGDIEAQEEEE